MLVALGVWCFGAAVGCRPAPGGKCDHGEARCLDANTQLVCDNGVFVDVPCRGKGGCVTVQESTTCDISRNQAGDRCGKTDEGAAVCAGDKAMLACHSGKFETVACLGPRGCELASGKANCDQSVANPGDPCSQDKAKACTAEQAMPEADFRAAHGGKSFAEHYGRNKNDRNAYGKCVSSKTASANAKQEAATMKAAKACKAERAADRTAFTTRYGGRAASAFGKCVSSKSKRS